MIRLTGATFALFVATSVQAMTPAPIPPPDGMITQVAFGCGPGQTLVNGACIARTAIRQTRRAVRRSYYGYGTGGYYGGYAAGGYPGGYYGDYANRSYVTGRSTLIPRHYGGYGTDGDCGGYGTGGYYDAYAAGSYPGGYYGGYANRSYVTGRPTLIPRHYGGGWGGW